MIDLLLSKFGFKETPKDRLERISEEIKSLEDHKFSAIKQRKNITSLLFLISGVIYAMICISFYFSYPALSSDWKQRFLNSLVVIFPFIVYLLIQLIQWYYRQVIGPKRDKLRGLRQERRKISEKIMETETYKVAKKLLQKYDPSALRRSRGPWLTRNNFNASQNRSVNPTK